MISWPTVSVRGKENWGEMTLSAELYMMSCKWVAQQQKSFFRLWG